MHIVFSRKGVDTGAGGCASPIVNGRARSLPIPAPSGRSATTYAMLGLGDLIERQSRERLNRDTLCHADPEFHAGRVAFGQVSAAQSHLRNQGVGSDDVFLFFGLFENEGVRAHRIYGWMKVEDIIAPAQFAEPECLIGGDFPHPHTLAGWGTDNTIYLGRGRNNAPAVPELCLTVPGAPVSHWAVPGWLRACGLSYHGRPERWLVPGQLTSVARGQEFVTDISDCAPAHDWLDDVIGRIGR